MAVGSESPAGRDVAADLECASGIRAADIAIHFGGAPASRRSEGG